MKNSIIKLALAGFAIAFSGCASTAVTTNDFNGANSKMLAHNSSYSDARESDLSLPELRALADTTNEEIKRIFPKSQKPKIVLWATDLENLVDGTFTQTFGDKLSPAPSLKLYNIFKNTGVSVLDHAHVAPCEGAQNSDAQYWVLRTYLSDLDETVHRKVKGFYPNAETGSIQAEIDKGTRSSTDKFKLSAKITECRSGRIIHAAESSFSKTTVGKDKSFYLFGKQVGVFYRNTESFDPGLNATKDIALDVFLDSIAREIVGVPLPDVTLAESSAKDVAKL